ncbi:MAG: tRNA pseudouridine(55) synthase TruB [Clostridia bacterium]|nr:tRNA pseudouridine(55) synthase TruB [Clostridia bacterium]
MNGFINIMKPTGMTSAAVVGVLRRLTGEKRVGHAGTLDPEAAGVLPIMIGKATRLFDYLVDRTKEYEAVIAFGSSTDTQDATGTVLETGGNYPDLETAREKAKLLTGDIVQKPSMYSAIKVDGKPLYARARKGETVEVPERIVRVDSIEITGEEPEHGMRMRVRCGKGTYIRSICDDLGKLCGCPAHMRSLTRTRSGYFTAETAVTLDGIRAAAAEGRIGEYLTAPDAPLEAMRRLDVPERLEKAVRAGAKLPLEKMTKEPPEEGVPLRIYLKGDFWGIGERQGEHIVWKAQIAPEEKEEKEEA